MHNETNSTLPMEIGPGQHKSVVISCVIAIAFSVTFWVATRGIDKPASIRSLVLVPAVTCLLVLYLKSMTLRLDDRGISRGFLVLRTFIPYERVAGVSREIQNRKGGPITCFVISERGTARRIVIPFISYDRTELARMMTLLARMAPQAQINAAQYIQVSR